MLCRKESRLSIEDYLDQEEYERPDYEGGRA